jgi:hypothetical protein
MIIAAQELLAEIQGVCDEFGLSSVNKTLRSVKNNHLSFYLKSFRERLSHNLEQVLGVQAKLEALEFTVGEIKKPDIPSAELLNLISIYFGFYSRCFFSEIFFAVISRSISSMKLIKICTA